MDTVSVPALVGTDSRPTTGPGRAGVNVTCSESVAPAARAAPAGGCWTVKTPAATGAVPDGRSFLRFCPRAARRVPPLIGARGLPARAALAVAGPGTPSSPLTVTGPVIVRFWAATSGTVSVRLSPTATEPASSAGAWIPG